MDGKYTIDFDVQIEEGESFNDFTDELWDLVSNLGQVSNLSIKFIAGWVE